MVSQSTRTRCSTSVQRFEIRLISNDKNPQEGLDLATSKASVLRSTVKYSRRISASKEFYAIHFLNRFDVPWRAEKEQRVAVVVVRYNELSFVRRYHKNLNFIAESSLARVSSTRETLSRYAERRTSRRIAIRDFVSRLYTLPLGDSYEKKKKKKKETKKEKENSILTASIS